VAPHQLNGEGWRQAAELGLPVLLSAAISLEREIRQENAGLRTDTLVGVGAALLMLLAAVDEGLGALFFGIPPHQIGEFRDLFGVPEQYLPIGAVAIGHPDPAADKGGSGKVIKRRGLEDLVHRGHW
jgi:nitroreductase